MWQLRFMKHLTKILTRLYAEFLDRLFEEKGSIWQR